MKSLLKEILPPFIVNLFRKMFIPKKENNDGKSKDVITWTGNYSSWQQALDKTSGYDNNEIMEKCRNSLLKVKNGEAVYERDSVLFNEIQYSWPLLAVLQRCALEHNNSLCVLDFGGSFGSTYFQNKQFLENKVIINWHIVEQKRFVEEGKKIFEDEKLKFFYTIEESLHFQRANIIILSSILQYLEFPYQILADILALKIPYVVIDRTAFVSNGNDILTVQDVQEEIYEASYPAWFFNIENFKKQFKNYDIIASFKAHEDYVIHLENGSTAAYRGFILKYRYDS